jgi:25S rRNA (cytosine2870-C5)-methyltransferase
VQRLGISNCIVVNYDGRKIPTAMKGFDKVLLDAPCTGLGVISRDPSIKSNRTLLDVKKAAHLQRELLRAAVDCCKVGGTIVYSTCSIAAEENEGVIDYIIKKRFVKVAETGLPIEKEGITSYEDVRYDPRVKLTRRVYPHMHNMDGFFIAKIIKVKDGKREDVEEKEEPTTQEVTVENKSKKSLGKRDRLRLKANLPVNQPPSAVVRNESGEDEVAGHDQQPARDELSKRKLDLKKRLLEKKKKLT